MNKDESKAVGSCLNNVNKKIMVMSGKGGVGKSSVSLNLAATLARNGFRVGILDVDFHGPSIPVMLGLQQTSLMTNGEKVIPAEVKGIKVMSIAFLLEGKNDAVIWRGPRKSAILNSMLEDVDWGELDYLIMDFPPGTGDEAMTACQTVADADGGIVVTTPQEVSLSDCRRAISFCDKMNLPVIGVIENMAGFACPSCNKIYDIFRSGGGKALSEESGVPFLGSLPLDPRMAESCDKGEIFIEMYPDSKVAVAFSEIIERL
ncbi:MAG: ATP-binding protein [Gammaproteobacteria bacterium]|nr:MAG: ATP-binding protein [Gammaproteobacteria bacterium]